MCESVLELVALDAYIATILMCLTEREPHDGLFLILYTDIYWRIVKLESQSISGHERELVDYWAKDVLVVIPDGEVTKAMRQQSNGKE